MISIFTTKLEGIIFVGGGSTPPPSALPSPEHEKINSIKKNYKINQDLKNKGKDPLQERLGKEKEA